MNTGLEEPRTFATSVSPECQTSAGLLVPMRRQEELTNRRISATTTGVTLIIPCFNAEQSIARTVRKAMAVLRGLERPFEVIVVDDGSEDGSTHSLQTLIGSPRLKLLRNGECRGYGYSLKRALGQARHELIAIIDADGTNPVERLPELIDGMKNADMVVGSRAGESLDTPQLRRPANWLIHKLADYLAGQRIPDLNSGMRVIKRSLMRRFVRLLPDGFGFPTTVTLAMLTNGFEVRYVPIDQARPREKSSLRPVRDTVDFLSLIVQMILCFRPLKTIVPAASLMLCLTLGTAIVSKVVFGQLAGVITATLALGSFQLFATGMLADLIDKRWPVMPQETQPV